MIFCLFTICLQIQAFILEFFKTFNPFTYIDDIFGKKTTRILFYLQFIYKISRKNKKTRPTACFFRAFWRGEDAIGTFCISSLFRDRKKTELIRKGELWAIQTRRYCLCRQSSARRICRRERR